MTFKLTSSSVFLVAAAGRYSTLFHSYCEEAQHGSGGSQRPVCPHLQRRQGEFGVKALLSNNRPVSWFATVAHCLFLILFYYSVSISVAAEQRILLPAAVFLMSSDRGEFHSSHRGNTSLMVSFMNSLLAGW